ncbi:hypothetical protein C2G38_2228364 [Gigaspora rosea]|uniref:Serine-threonine/tyrosine-protein kinase catalytic domain-containing protein n=1 Tax=Gigaspora rosea TaxID=44941 RepID=A0A397TWJ6_9GLOM|nr:hypothetical protein C2G38_2228364 [Gigaspora rosea]
MGNASRTNEVSFYYINGIEIEIDEYKEFIYYQKSADMGYALGTNNVGNCYFNGIGVEKDKYKEFIYYQKAAEMGTLSQSLILEFVTNMELVLKRTKRKQNIVEKNIDIAYEWYLKLAMTEQYTTKTKEIFHWIPYNKFENIEQIGKELKACHSLDQYLGISRDEKNKRLYKKILLKENYEAYITDLGLSKPLDEKEQEECIHRVFFTLYCTRTFSKNSYTKVSEIYSFEIIMVEMTTGQRSFNEYKFDLNLAVIICNFGLRPNLHLVLLIAMLSWQFNV